MVVLYSVIVTWAISTVLAFVNLGMILRQSRKSSGRFLATNLGIYTTYLLLGFILFAGGFNSFGWILGVVLGVPIMAIIHFCYLLIRRRRLRAAQRKQEALVR